MKKVKTLEKGGDLVKKDDILQFEEDDTSEIGINGKQVFFTKRINGETTHNKSNGEDNMYNSMFNNINKEEELFIEFNTPYNPKENSTKKKNNNKKNQQNKKKSNNNQKKKKKGLVVLRLLLLIAIIIGVIIFAMVSPIFNIREVEIEGNNKIKSETIISLSGIQEGENIFRIRKKDITNKLKENTYINSVSIKRKMPGTLNITIEERKIAYQIKVINSYVYIDYQGYILETSSKSEKVPVIEGLSTSQDDLLNARRLSTNDIEALKTILRIVDTAKTADISKLISKIIIQDGQYILEIKDKNKTVYLGDATDITNKIMYLKIILNKEKNTKGKIFINGNLNNGFKPYFREDEGKDSNE